MLPSYARLVSVYQVDVNRESCMANRSCLCHSFEFPVRMAFQPIVDVLKKEVVSYEALVRGSNGESAFEVVDRTIQTRELFFSGEDGDTWKYSHNSYQNTKCQIKT